jgi:hypothetical protein
LEPDIEWERRMSEATPADLFRMARDISDSDGAFRLPDLYAKFGNMKRAQFDRHVQANVEVGRFVIPSGDRNAAFVRSVLKDCAMVREAIKTRPTDRREAIRQTVREAADLMIERMDQMDDETECVEFLNAKLGEGDTITLIGASNE